MLRPASPCCLCDKVVYDRPGRAAGVGYDFYSLGLDELVPVSSVHGHGKRRKLEAVCAHLPGHTGAAGR